MSERKRRSVDGSLPKPDVLERLEEWYANMVGIWASDYPKLVILADAIAEIKRKNTKLRDHERRMAEDSVAIQEFKAKLREYTVAEQVWQARRVVYGHAFGWSGIHKSEVDDYATRRNCEVRRLIVAPKAESDEEWLSDARAAVAKVTGP